MTGAVVTLWARATGARLCNADESPADDGPHRTVRLTFNIPLSDFTWSNGSMEILPSTHLLSRAFLARSVQEIPRLYPVRLDLTVGDAVLRDGNGLHRGTPNLTEAPRLMLDQTYRTASRVPTECA